MSHVFTDMPLDVAIPVTESRCGLCDRFARCCPAKTVRGARDQFHLIGVGQIMAFDDHGAVAIEHDELAFLHGDFSVFWAKKSPAAA